jgi:hypothetical protein
VTAEFAAAMPAVLLVLSLCLGAVQTGVQRVRLADAAADAARSLARGDGAGRAAAIVARSVVGAAIAEERDGEFVCARAAAPIGFGPFAALGLRAEARACALDGGL